MKLHIEGSLTIPAPGIKRVSLWETPWRTPAYTPPRPRLSVRGGDPQAPLADKPLNIAKPTAPVHDQAKVRVELPPPPPPPPLPPLLSTRSRALAPGLLLCACGFSVFRHK